MKQILNDLKYQLKEDLKDYELIDNDSKVHYNLITTDTCYQVTSRYLQALYDLMSSLNSERNKKPNG